MVNISEDHLQELVGDDGAAVSKPKERVVCEHSAHTHHASMEDTLMAQSTESLEGEEMQPSLSL